MNFISLFSGVGGIDLGLERAGMTCIAQVEIDPFCRAVLARHWPHVLRFEDVRTFGRESIHGPVDCIAGGFPCQPVSGNGQKKAQNDERWLWPEMCRVVCAFSPPLILLENVTGLLERGFSDVLGDLARIGYDAEWDSIPAATFGAPHLRERVFLVAYPASPRLERKEPTGRIWGRGLLAQCDRWAAEPGVPRMGYGIPSKMDRIKALGNSVVPQVAEYIGERLMAIMSPGV